MILDIRRHRRRQAVHVNYTVHPHLMLWVLFISILVACGSSNQIPPPLTPDTLPAELGASEDLSGAVDEFSIRLGLDPSQIKIRIQFRGCETCEVRQPPKQPPDLSLSRALEELQPNDKLWLVAPNVTCYYNYDGKTVSPLACQEEPNSNRAP